MLFEVRVYFSEEDLCLLKSMEDAAPWNLRALCDVNSRSSSIITFERSATTASRKPAKAHLSTDSKTAILFNLFSI
jgi:hypothetical protein